jgi:DNA-binding NarL/FixJ family response regulator
MPTAEIAKRMGLVKHTAKLHTMEIYSKLNVSTRAELMATLMQPTKQAREMMGRYAG